MSDSKGFSLVDLIIALCLGIMLIAGAGQLFLSANKTYRMQDQLIRIQENARMALDLLIQDIRMSAYTGCPASVDLGNALHTSDPERLWMAHFDKGILGIPSGSKVQNDIDAKALSEAVIVHRLDWEKSMTVVGQSSSEAKFTLASKHDFNQGDLLGLVAKNCKQVNVFISNYHTKGSIVGYGAIDSGGLTNCTKLYRGDFTCMDNQKGLGSANHDFSLLMPVLTTAYYVRENNRLPTLYRKRAGETISGKKLAAEALVEGIENLSIRYGYDSDHDGIVNQYLKADQIQSYSHDWKHVMSVRIELLARSLIEISSNPQDYFFSGIKIIPSDHYIRRVLVATVRLRNRGN